MRLRSTIDKPPRPIKRKNDTVDVIIFLTVYGVFYLYAKWYSRTNIFLLSFFSTVCVMFFPLFKILLFWREFILWQNYYEGFTDLLLKSIKLKSWRSFVSAVLLNGCSLVYLLHKSETKFLDTLNTEFRMMDAVTVGFLYMTLGLYFQWGDNLITESYSLEESFTFSGGSCMALGFFNGYIKLIIGGFLDRINKFQSCERLDDKMVPEKKLFILIPSSTFIFDKLRKTGKELLIPMEDALEYHQQDRGMVIKRVYKNSVYKVWSEKKNKVKYYVPLEGASPLKTFYETCRFFPQYKDFKKEVVSAFYYTLEALISEDKDVKGLVELVYYDDEKDSDVDIAAIIKKRMKYLKQDNDKTK